MEQLGGLDAAFLSCETPTMHMHVCGLLVLDTSTMGEGDPCEHIRAMLEERLPGIAPMRHKLATVPLNVGRPFWTDDAGLHIDRHLRRVRLAPPADVRKLAELAGEFASTQLRRDRPLWEMLLVEGLPGDQVALLVKMHHATVDGITGANLMGELFDLAPVPPPASLRTALPASRAPKPFELLVRTLLKRLVEPVEIVKLLPTTVGQVGGAVWQLAVRGNGTPGMTMPFTAPRTSFNATVTGKRTVAFIDVPLQEVKAVRQAFGVTVNDVLTAVVGGALRRYLADRGELPERPLVAAEPISVHEQAHGVQGVAKMSVMFTTLATDVDDPVERLRTIAASNTLAKELHAMVGADTLLQWSEHFWLNGFSLGARLYSRLHGADYHPVIHNLILSNVPGPTIPLYLAGARLVGIYPLGPLMDGAGLNVTILSEEDRVGFGIVACADLVPDVWQLAEAIPEALHEIGTCARGVGNS
ncbi:MAG: WS/DGAT/MGAT family O-acyltransferase [Acidimicrobiales bacterium]